MIQVKAYPPEDTATTISINAIGGLQYDLVRFKVKSGAKVKIILTNKDDVSHNLLITQPGARLEVVDASLKLGNDGLKMNYIPKLPEVLWSIKMLAPGETKSITFTTSKKPGVYPYVCTYPGHGFLFELMHVSNEAIPAIKNDPNIPPNRRNADIIMHNKHKHLEVSNSSQF